MHFLFFLTDGWADGREKGKDMRYEERRGGEGLGGSRVGHAWKYGRDWWRWWKVLMRGKIELLACLTPSVWFDELRQAVLGIGAYFYGCIGFFTPVARECYVLEDFQGWGFGGRSWTAAWHGWAELLLLFVWSLFSSCKEVRCGHCSCCRHWFFERGALAVV